MCKIFYEKNCSRLHDWHWEWLSLYFRVWRKRNALRLFCTVGKEVVHLLDILRSANFNLYSRLEFEWQNYANCVGMVDTGYFKRSGGAVTKFSNPFKQHFPRQGGLWDALIPTSRQVHVSDTSRKILHMSKSQNFVTIFCSSSQYTSLYLITSTNRDVLVFTAIVTLPFKNPL